jgi:hypothetical protein
MRFGLGKSGSERKTYNCTDFDIGSLQDGADTADPVRIDADGEETVFLGFGAEFFDLWQRGIGTEEGVVDQSGEVGVGRHK